MELLISRVQSVHSRNLPGWDEEPTHTMEISLIDIQIFGNERERVINAVDLFMTCRKGADSLFGNGMVDGTGPLEETINNHISAFWSGVKTPFMNTNLDRTDEPTIQCRNEPSRGVSESTDGDAIKYFLTDSIHKSDTESNEPTGFNIDPIDELTTSSSSLYGPIRATVTGYSPESYLNRTRSVKSENGNLGMSKTIYI